ncbi:MAG: hypothetical protein U1F51_20695 [Burkholderiales bacterium]
MIATLAAGCAIGPLGGTPAPPRVADAACVRLFEAIDAEVARAGTGDGGTARVEGFRTLRVDRLLASYAGEPMDAGRFGDWVGAMRSLDRNARAVEIANLPQERRARVRALVDALPADVADPDAGDAGRIDACAERVLALDLEVPGARAFILSAASVPDDYDDRLRALGLYPFTAFGYAAGIRVYERETRAAWSLPLADLPRRGVSKIYRPVGAAVDVAELRRTVGALVASDAFPPAPRADPAAVERLFAAYAPAWVIDEATPADRPGHVVLRADGRPDVDPASVVVTTRLAWTRFDRTLLPQLVYTIWFPDRPSQFPGDPLAGRLDGLVWRVTLDRDGAPLVFDTIHACGCYHQFIPTGRLVERPAAGSVEEGALVVQTLPPLTAGPRATLVVASGTHYLRRVLIGEDPAEDPRSAASSSAVITYTLAADGDLRSLRDNGGGTRSLFRPDGLVGGSERPERALFWPTGIVSAGAMRQWGRHATAFVGRRHFDEPFLIERYFSRADR